MSYRCELCKAQCPHGQPRRVHTIYRKDGQIASEIPVCQECWEDLGLGVSFVVLREELMRGRVEGRGGKKRRMGGIKTAPHKPKTAPSRTRVSKHKPAAIVSLKDEPVFLLGEMISPNRKP